MNGSSFTNVRSSIIHPDRLASNTTCGFSLLFSEDSGERIDMLPKAHMRDEGEEIGKNSSVILHPFPSIRIPARIVILRISNH